uniref:Bm9809 n=1 Tax=Brugia malayi TaxID=6279 RepID=A0A0J9XTS5_BRUMA|nr:Bm9809 [Brugia malayi]
MRTALIAADGRDNGNGVDDSAEAVVLSDNHRRDNNSSSSTHDKGINNDHNNNNNNDTMIVVMTVTIGILTIINYMWCGDEWKMLGNVVDNTTYMHLYSQTYTCISVQSRLCIYVSLRIVLGEEEKNHFEEEGEERFVNWLLA